MFLFFHRQKKNRQYNQEKITAAFFHETSISINLSIVLEN